MRWPLYRRELRSRHRKIRALVFPLVYAFLLCGIFVFATVIVVRSYREGPSAMQEQGVGRMLFLILTYLQTALFAMVTPSFTAAALVGERSEKTLGLLAVTLLKPASVLFQKFVSALSSILVFVAVGLPVVALCYALGGVSVSEIGFYYAYLLVTVLSFGALGLLFSVIARKTYLSFVLTYLVVAYLVMGCFIVGGLVVFLIQISSAWGTSLQQLYGVFTFVSPVAPLIELSSAGVLPSWEVPAYFVFHIALIVCGLFVSYLVMRGVHRFR